MRGGASIGTGQRAVESGFPSTERVALKTANHAFNLTVELRAFGLGRVGRLTWSR